MAYTPISETLKNAAIPQYLLEVANPNELRDSLSKYVTWTKGLESLLETEVENNSDLTLEEPDLKSDLKRLQSELKQLRKEYAKFAKTSKVQRIQNGFRELIDDTIQNCLEIHNPPKLFEIIRDRDKEAWAEFSKLSKRQVPVSSKEFLALKVFLTQTFVLGYRIYTTVNSLDTLHKCENDGISFIMKFGQTEVKQEKLRAARIALEQLTSEERLQIIIDVAERKQTESLAKVQGNQPPPQDSDEWDNASFPKSGCLDELNARTEQFQKLRTLLDGWVSQEALPILTMAAEIIDEKLGPDKERSKIQKKFEEFRAMVFGYDRMGDSDTVHELTDLGQSQIRRQAQNDKLGHKISRFFVFNTEEVRWWNENRRKEVGWFPSAINNENRG